MLLSEHVGVVSLKSINNVGMAGWRMWLTKLSVAVMEFCVFTWLWLSGYGLWK